MRQAYRDELKAKKRKKFFSKLLAFFLVLLGVFAIAVYLLFFSNLLAVESVAINGAETIERTNLETAVGGWLDAGFLGIKRRSDSLFLSTKNLTSYLMAKFPKLDSAIVVRKLPHGLEISVSERKPAGIWCLAKTDSCFYFDKNAIAYANTSGSSGFLVTIVSDFRDRTVELGSPVASDDWFKNIILAKELLPRAGVSVSEFVIPADSFDEFNVKTSEGWKIMLSNQTNIGEQISALASLMEEKIKPEQRAKLQYIDLRIQDRIYYK